jgi:hypothetical protein
MPNGRLFVAVEAAKFPAANQLKPFLPERLSPHSENSLKVSLRLTIEAGQFTTANPCIPTIARSFFAKNQNLYR